MIDLNNPEAKEGALAAIDILRRSKISPIRIKGGEGEGEGGKLRLPRNTEEAPDDLTNDELNQIDPDGDHSLNRAENARAELEKDRDQILKDIKQDVDDKRTEVARAKAREMEKIKAEARKKGIVTDISNFGNDLNHTMKTQMHMSKKPEDTYLRPNPAYAGTPYILPGHKVLEKQNKATINVYFDVSGSVTERALQIALATLAKLDIYVKKGRCQYEILYFADSVSPDRKAVAKGGTHAFPDILRHIKKTRVKNAIIITDRDFDYQTDWTDCETVTIPGVIWWFWDNSKHNKQRATKAMNYINARSGMFQYWVE